ncbi:MAG TPA: hypothetical protein VN326_01210 [Casimicrobiaceae bacterium]|jgi:hypothetical protein|nr:hypothetical protein [Casimicrobiaceae bacterium]
MSIDIADPRAYSAPTGPIQESLIRLAEASLVASSASRAEEIDAALVSALAAHLHGDDALWLADLFSASPSAAVARHIWRRLIDAWRAASAAEDDRVVATLFALPVVIVAGATANESAPVASTLGGVLAGVLVDAERVTALLREHHALGGNQSLALATPLVAADALDIPRLPTLLAWQNLSTSDGPVTREVHPTPMVVHSSQEGVHLRFLIGTAIGTSAVDVFAGKGGGQWIMPLAQELSRQLATTGLSVLALPRPPQAPLLALQHGRAAQREVGAQLFASNAIRRFRARVGEPSAVISAHRCAAAPGGGELRLSLSSPFDPRQAEGFRCPLFPPDRAVDVATMLLDLLHDCRVTDVRVIAGAQADRDPDTGLTLLFRADAVPDGAAAAFQ